MTSRHALPAMFALLLGAFTTSFGSAAASDPIADFYKGKQLRIVIRAEPGGNYDIYSRLLGRFMTLYIPGAPTAVPMNMPGGGGLTALNYVANIAPRDGTTITMITQSMPMEQALRIDSGLKVDLRSLNCIGNMSSDNEFLFTIPSSPTRTIADARTRQTLIAATGSASVSTYVVAAANNRLGTRFKVLFGYPSGPAMNMALARGEAEGRTTSNPESALLGNEPADFNYLLQVGRRRDPAFPSVPLLTELATSEEDRQVLGFLSDVISLSRPVCAAPGIPADRLAALRTAFSKAMADERFQQEAAKLRIPVSFTEGTEVQRIMNAILDAPPETIRKVRDAIELRPLEAEGR